MPPARSSAAQTRPRTEARPHRTPPRPQRVVLRDPFARLRWDRVGRVAMLVVLTIVALLYAQHILAYLSTRSQAERQLSIVQTLARQNRALLAEQKALSDPATIQRDARALGMVKRGERAYVITGLPSR